MPAGLKWSKPAQPLFQKSSSAHIFHSCHKGQPGQFKQCGLVITGQNITRQYFCMNFHEKLCNTTQCHTMHSNFTKRTRVLWTHFFPSSLQLWRTATSAQLLVKWLMHWNEGRYAMHQYEICIRQSYCDAALPWNGAENASQRNSISIAIPLIWFGEMQSIGVLFKVW